MNMSTEKAERTSLNPAIIALIVAVGAISINAPIVGSEGIETSFGLERGGAAIILGSFAVGYALGHLVIGLTAHMISWRWLLLASLAGYVLSCIVAAFSSSIEMLQLARMAQGLFAAAAPLLGRAIVRTINHDGQATRVFVSAFALFAWAPVIAPLAAGYLVGAFDWRIVFWGLLFYAAGLSIFLLMRAPMQLSTDTSRAAFSWSDWISVVRENEARTGLAIAVIAFASFFTQLVLADEHDKTGLDISVIVTLIASSFAIGGAASRVALGFVSRAVALRLWNGGIVLFAMLALIASVAGSAAWIPLCLSCLLALCAGALTPIATFMSMGHSSASAPRALAILGATKMAVSSVIAYSLSATEFEPFLLTGVIVFALTVLALGLVLSLKGELGD